MVGVCGKGHLGVIFYVGRGVLREWVDGGGGLDGYFGEQGLAVGIWSALRDFSEDAVTISAGSLFRNVMFALKHANENTIRALRVHYVVSVETSYAIKAKLHPPVIL